MTPIDGKTKLCCLLGKPVEHSMSPCIHNACFKALGLNYCYLCFAIELAQLGDAITSIRALKIAGVNVTVPYKEKVMKFLDKIDPVAKKIGAVNTITLKKNKLIGSNTDWIGAQKALEEKAELKNKKVLLIGAGGAARAVCFALRKKKAHILIANRTRERAVVLAQEFNGTVINWNTVQKTKADILINATPVGMFPKIDESPLPKTALGNFAVVFDTIYNPLETKLLKLAKESGCITISGLAMLMYQAAASFELWTGVYPDTTRMYDAAYQKLQQ